MKSIAGLSTLAIALVLGSGAACVPTGSAPPYDAGATTTATTAAFKPSLNVMSGAFEENFDRPDAGEGTWAALEAGAAAAAAAPSASKDAGEAGAAGGDAGDLYTP